MKSRSLTLAVSPLLLLAANGFSAAPLPPFYGAPPDAHRPWSVHDRNRPQPVVVTPGTPSTQEQPGKPPSDAILLFDGTEASLAKWEMEPKDGKSGVPAKWIVKDGALECVPRSGSIQTKEKLGDVQLHVEWAAPTEIKGESQGRGNSGIIFMGLFEVQVLDNYNNPTYPDGSANSVYAVNPPMVNALRPPGQFQSVDIIFRRPIYKDAKLVEPGRVTVLCNGVVVQDSVPVLGENYHKVGWRDKPFPAAGPLKFQDHGDKVRFRNVWYRPLAPRPIDGGFDGVLTAEATAAKRKEVAAQIRADAAKLKGTAELLRLAESLVYEKEPAAYARVEQLAASYAADIKALAPAAIEQRKGEIQNVTSAFQYLASAKVFPEGFAPTRVLTGVAKAQGWDQQKK